MTLAPLLESARVLGAFDVSPLLLSSPLLSCSAARGPGLDDWRRGGRRQRNER
jgi:hypothetical protein